MNSKVSKSDNNKVNEPGFVPELSPEDLDAIDRLEDDTVYYNNRFYHQPDSVTDLYPEDQDVLNQLEEACSVFFRK